MPPVAAFAAAYAASNIAAGIGLSIAAQATIAASAAAIASSATTLLIISGISYALSTLLKPKVNTAQGSSGQQNLRQAIPPRIRFYGENLTGGYWAFFNADAVDSGDSAIFYGVLVTAHGESNAVLDRYLNARRILDTSPSDFDVTWETVAAVDFKDDFAYVGSTNIKNYLGTDSQLSDPVFYGKWGDAWTIDHRLRGCTVTYLLIPNVETPAMQSRRFPGGGLPVYTERRQTSKLYDPRSTLTAYSENSALVLADFLSHVDGWGLGIGTIDWTNIEIEADVCDEDVLSRGEGTIKRYITAGGYNLNDPRQDVLGDLLLACDALLLPMPDGKVGIKVGRWEDPTVTVNPVSILRMQGRKYATGPGEVNIIRPTYVDRRLQFKETESKGYYESDTPAWGTPPSEEEIISPVQMLWVPHHNQAVRLSKRLLRVMKATWTVNIVLDQFGLLLLGERFFELNYPVYGISGMAFEIQKVKILAGGLSVEVDAISVAESDWDFDPETEEPTLPEVPDDPDAGVPVEDIAMSDDEDRIMEDDENVVVQDDEE